MVEHGQTLSAEGVAAVNQYAGYLLAYVELVSTVVAEVKAPALVIALNQLVGLFCILFVLDFLNPRGSLFPESNMSLEPGLPLILV